MKQDHETCQINDALSQLVLNSISAHIAIIDEEGFIVGTNRAWERFAVNTGSSKRSIGLNYLSVCDAASGEGSEDAHRTADGLRAVIRGKVEEFLYDYPCHSPTSRHWFYMRAIKMTNADPVRVIISHEEITALKLAQEALKQSKQALEEQKKDLQEANIALKVLLRQRESDKQNLEETVLTNIKGLVFPFIEKLKIAPLRPKDKAMVELIETHLNEIISPMLNRLTHANIFLTPQEIQVAALVKDGKSSKEIAEILVVAETTVHFHRKNLRKKLGLKNKNANLRSYLLSLS